MPTRDVPIHGGKGLFEILTSQSSFPYTRERLVRDALEFSEGHIWPVPKRLKGYYNAGGDVTITSHTYRPRVYNGKSEILDPSTGKVAYRITGDCFPADLRDVSWPGPSPLSDNDLRGFGTKAIAATIPTKPKAQVAQFLAELRDLPKHPGEYLKEMKHRSRFFKNLAKHSGSEYLNYEFGWKPFVSDIAKTTKSCVTAADVLRQFDRDSGKIVRRKMDLGTTRSVTGGGTASHISADPSFWSYFDTGDGVLSTLQTQERKVWFSAAYQYYVPPAGDSLISQLQNLESHANKMFGTRITPGVLWELAPWSWLADYFGNFGDVVNNWSAFSNDNLVCNYAFIMSHTKVTKTYNWSGTLKDGKAINTSFDLITESKQRLRASPYGFSVSSSFTNKQLEIMAGLGLSKLPTQHF